MPEPHTLGLFVLAALVLVLIPGPGVLYIVARSVDQGRRAGLLSVLGVGGGNMVQVLWAALGLSALVASSALAFDVLRYAGAAYLVWLGLMRLRAPDEAIAGAVTETPTVPRGRIIGQGVLVAALNPKTAVFFVAFLPQFIDPAQGSVALQALGSVFVALALCTDALYALASGTLADRFRGRAGARVARASKYGTAAVYMALGAATAATGVRRR
ncbi:LysE family translocator [Svornostia abyssi]|uniref:LysE family translocator n=1 Tax=Svornostia abyssi TaxID=2898438 RepID=A0ABY5PA85_9ACTN|nr:LysE family translocator [Parviterribacteraceae bacterium J379]